MLHNLVSFWQKTHKEQEPFINKESKDINEWVNFSSIHFSTPPDVFFVDNFVEYNVISYYQYLPTPPLSPDDKARLENAEQKYDAELIEAKKNNQKPPFYNGDNILGAGLSYDAGRNILFLQAYRINYWFIRAMQNKIFAEDSAIYQSDFFTLGVQVPFTTEDGFTYFMKRASKATPFYAPIAGFLEVKQDTALDDIFPNTAKEELVEELLGGHNGNPHWPRVSFYSEGLSALSFVRAELGSNNFKTVDFVYATRVQCKNDTIITIIRNNKAQDAKEHTGDFFSVDINNGRIPSSFVMNVREGMTYFPKTQPQAPTSTPGVFSYGRAMAAVAIAEHAPPHLPKELPGTHGRLFQIPKNTPQRALVDDEERRIVLRKR